MTQHTFTQHTSLRFLQGAAGANMSEEEYLTHLMDQVLPTHAPTPIPYEEALSTALDRAEAKKSGEEFRVEQLFTPDEWERVQAKKHVGRFFRIHAEPDLVTHIGKTDTNHAIYRRI